MDNPSIHQFLTIVTWLALSMLLVLLALIARKYETLSGERTYYRLFAVPVLAFAGAALRQVQTDQITGDPAADLFLLAGGLVLAGLCLNVYRRMTSGR